MDRLRRLERVGVGDDVGSLLAEYFTERGTHEQVGMGDEHTFASKAAQIDGHVNSVLSPLGRF